MGVFLSSPGPGPGPGPDLDPDYDAAVKWFVKAASQGNKQAFFNLGFCYANGRGIEKNPVMAYVCFFMSVASGDTEAVVARDEAEKKLSPAQVAEGKRLASEWREKHPKPDEE